MNLVTKNTKLCSSGLPKSSTGAPFDPALAFFFLPMDIWWLIWWTFRKAWAHKNRLLKLSFLPLVCFFLRRFSRLESRWMGKFDTMRLSYIAKATSVQNVIRVTWRRGPFWLGTSQFADYVKDQTMVLWQSLFNKHRTYPETIQGVPSLNPKRMVKWLVAWVSFQERMKKKPARKTPDQDANIFFSKKNTQFLYIKCPV